MLTINSTYFSHLTSLSTFFYAIILYILIGDVQLNKVKFNAKHEYEYVANFKVLQTAFDKHKLDKVRDGSEL